MKAIPDKIRYFLLVVSAVMITLGIFGIAYVIIFGAD